MHCSRALLVMAAYIGSGVPSALAGDEALKPAASPAKIDFARDVRPILEQHCTKCHGEKTQEGGLRLTAAKHALAGGDSGEKVLVPGSPDESRLIKVLLGRDPDLQMPPEKEGARLKAEEIATLIRWVAEGASWPDAPVAAAAGPTHWAWSAPVAPPIPQVKTAAWARNEVDQFVLARLEREGLQPAAEADRLTLFRRASLDLTGLPPTRQQVNELVADTGKRAYERAVDRLLASDAYAERWALVWLDLARFADSKGYGADPIRTIWRFRDWVVDAFKENMPYDRFTVEQMAGDMLPAASRQQILATAFHRNSMSNNEGGVDDAEFRLVSVRDRLESTMQIWMGLTFGCARCHTHKFDPISHREYYQALAFLDQTQDSNSLDEEPLLRSPSAEQQRELAVLAARISDVKAGAAAGVQSGKLQLALLEKQYAALNKQAPLIPVMQELPRDKRRTTRILIKGSYLDQGDAVEPAVPAAFHPLPTGAPRNRLAFALWLVDRKNPLTARVTVNRYWAQLFGTGLVASEEDFGTQGLLPSHPELLDWLAVDFMRDWDLKRLLRTVVLSATYRQSSAASAEVRARDPANRLLARGPRFRLSAEAIRDQALAVSGLLSHKKGGPSVYPPQPNGLWRFTDLKHWDVSKGEDRYRRSVYTFWRRAVPHPPMVAFDAPSREVCTLRRRPTNTPLQALVALNDPMFVEIAQALARRIVAEGGRTPHERADFVLRTCQVRTPSRAQIDAIVQLAVDEHAHYEKHPEQAVLMATDPLGPLPHNMEPADLAAWTVVANVALNLDGVLTKN